MNNERTRNHYDAFARIAAFGTLHGDQFAAGSRGAALFATMANVVSKMEDAGVKKLSGTGDFLGGTDAKRVAANALREEMRVIRATAVAISEEAGLPDFHVQFLMPRSYAHDVLLTTARTFLKEATKQAALFLEFAMPADFLAHLAKAIKGLSDADDTQDSGLAGQVSGTAELSAQLARGRKTRNSLMAVVRNKFRTNPGVLAQWETASHVVRPNAKRRDRGRGREGANPAGPA